MLLASSDPFISEFVASNNSLSGIKDEDGDASDWLEIYNPSTSAVNLNGWYLTDTASQLTEWKIPNVSLGGKKSMMLWASSKDRSDPSKPLHTNFNLKASGEYLALVKPDGVTVVSEFSPTFPPQTTNISYGTPVQSSTIFDVGATGKYFIPTNANPASNWNTVAFNDSSWTGGTTGIGYNTTGAYDSVIGTNIQSALQNKQTSAYLRVPFNVADATALDGLTLRMKYDDGFVAYLNGVEVARKNAPTTPAWNSTATASVPGTTPSFTDFDLSNFVNLLNTGNNVLAIQGLNDSKGSADFLIAPQLVGLTETGAPTFLATSTPGQLNISNTTSIVADPKFDHDRGFYSSPFDLAISDDTPGASIRYTLDGSAPTTSTGTLYTGPIHVATTTVVRAIAYNAGAIATDPISETYIFPTDVIKQPANIAGYPNPQELVSNPEDGVKVALDYQMDPTVVNDPAYSTAVITGLTSIPTISLTVDPSKIFGASGFYDTDDVEVGAAAELIDPAHMSDNFSIDMSLSGHSKSEVKRSLTLKFKSGFGPSKLQSKIFQDAILGGDSATDTFDSIILRAGNNRSWARTSSHVGAATFTEDEWMRQTQLAMTGEESHGQFVQLYINGLYWGLYNAVERPDEGFGSQYEGGSSDDWFAISQDGVNNGDATRWNYLNNTLITKDMTNSSNYAELEQYLDVKEFSDYLIAQWWAGTSDWPGNNWWAGGRTDINEPFKYFAWDAEFSFDISYPMQPPPNGAWVHPYFLPGSTNTPMVVREWNAAIKNKDFQTLFADEVYKNLFNGGALTDQNAIARFDTLNNYIKDAVVDESARWGDTLEPIGGPLRTRNVDWQNEVNNLRGIMNGNGARLIAALRSAGFYPSIDPATMNQHGGLVPSGFKVTLTNPNGAGTIYYTLDGTDPRLAGGGIAPGALIYTGSTNLKITGATHLNLRILSGSTWSALNSADFAVNTVANLRVSEMMYHPKLPAGSTFTVDDYEFIELTNIGNTSLDLGGVKLDTGISFTFPAGTLAPGQRVLVVSNKTAFEQLYGTGLNIAGTYSGHLSDSGEEVRLLDPTNGILADFTYADSWYPTTDGSGFSLVVNDPTADPSTLNDPASWHASGLLNGTPGADEIKLAPGSVIINEVLSSSTSGNDFIELRNTTGHPIDLSNWFLSDSPTNLKKFKIPAGTVIAANGFLVFTEAQYGAAFGLDKDGDSAWLSSADSNGILTGYGDGGNFSGADPDVPFARYTAPDGGADFAAEVGSTPGATNGPLAVGPIVFNELDYNPGAGGAEFLELRNITNSDVPLFDPANPTNGWKFTNGITYTFSNATIPAGGFALVVGMDPNTFRSTYNVPADVQIFGPYSGSFDNGGETIELSKPGAPNPDQSVPYIVVDKLKYDDEGAWPTSPDGNGPTLAKIDSTVFSNAVSAWQASSANNGTPGLDNFAPTVNVTASDANASEANLDKGTYTFTRTGSTLSALTVNFTISGTATNGTDYETLPTSVVIPAGKSSVTLDLTPKDDQLLEGNETAIVTLAADVHYTIGANAAATINLADDDVPPTVTVSATDNAAAEPGSNTGTWTFTRTGNLTQDLTVLFDITGTATSGTDYTALPASVTIPANQTTATLTLTPLDDSAVEGSETVILTLKTNPNSSYSVGNPSSDTVNIADDDVLPSVSVSANDPNASEAGPDAGQWTFTRTGDLSQALLVNFVLSGTATNGTDYNSITQSITIPATKSSVTLDLTPIDDSAVEGSETATLTLSSSAAYTIGNPPSASITIADNDQSAGFSAHINFQPANVPTYPGYAVDSGLVYGARGNGLTYGWNADNSPQTRDKDSALSLDQRYDTLIHMQRNGTFTWNIAVPNGTYQVHIVSGDAGFIDSTFKINAENTLVVNGKPTDANHWVEGTATVTVSDGKLTISNASGASNNKIDFIDIQQLSSPPVKPTVTITATDNTASEPGADTGAFTFTRTGDTTSALTVNFTISGTATNGTDYNTLPTSITIPAGQASAILTLTAKDDALVEGTETAKLAIASNANYTIGSASNATVNILDNDAAAKFSAHINFQPANVPTYPGYLVDSGLVYGSRGNGLTYGWNADNSAQTRDKDSNLSLDQRYDTLIHMQRNGTFTWNIAVPNGKYQVHIVSGDAGFIDSVFKISAEGTLVVNGTPTNANHWVEGTATVTVSDGKFTIANASGASNNKIDYIDIQQV